MPSSDLRARLAVAVADRGIVKVNENHVETLDGADYTALLAALGLQDLDAAVRRMQVASAVPNPSEPYMRRLLLAALSSESQRG